MRVGDKIRIIKNDSMHDFNIGDVVTMISVKETEVIGGAKQFIYMAQKGTEKYYVASSDFEKAK